MAGGGLRQRLKDRTSGGWCPSAASPYWPDQRGGRPFLGFEDITITKTAASTAGGEITPGLRLDLFIAPGERIEGHVNVVGEKVPVPFKGWVEFMAAVDSLRTRGGRRDITVPVTGRTTERTRSPRKQPR